MDNSIIGYDYQTQLAIDSFSQKKSNLAYEKKTENKKSLRLINGRLKSIKVLKREEKICRIKSVAVITISLLCFIMLVLAVFSSCLLNEVNFNRKYAQERLSIAQSDSVELESEKDAILSTANIDKYAVEKLGMNKKGVTRYMDVQKNTTKLKAKNQKKVVKKSTLEKIENSITKKKLGGN